MDSIVNIAPVNFGNAVDSINSRNSLSSVCSVVAPEDTMLSAVNCGGNQNIDSSSILATVDPLSSDLQYETNALLLFNSEQQTFNLSDVNGSGLGNINYKAILLIHD